MFPRQISQAPWALVLFALCFACPAFLRSAALPEDEDTRFLVLDSKGNVLVFRDESESRSRLRKGQYVDDGDRIVTGPKSEVVLRLKGQALLHLSPNTKLNITRLHWFESRGLQVRLNLLQGRVLAQMDKAPDWAFEVSAGKLICRAHGTLFEAVRQKDRLSVVSFEGSVVVRGGARVQIAKSLEYLRFDKDKFRFKRSVRAEEEAHLAEFKSHMELLFASPRGNL